nr:TetR/AcrR family transcriptional regulator [Kibdelosporangium sp. MJ126-NF4]CEL18002.1 putative transcription regulator [Kibdelosporangium sp. MJ126-NF4]CTQ90770.1 putative transcription regulator [Kibdelosporangium sp. MJ126-NF4]
MSTTRPATTSRRRPATRKGRPTLTRELIAGRALHLAGAEGFPAVTMRRLAEDLGVTVRALYNYVDDRREVVELATQLLMSYWQVPELDVDRWEDSVRAYCAQMRSLYRRFPRALLVSLDEDIQPSGIHPARLRNPDMFLGLLRGIGLSPLDALQVHTELGLKLFGFALLIDYRDADGSPVPEEWLATQPDLHVPHLAEAVRETAKPTPDEFFDHIVDTLILAIRACVPAD